MSPTARTLKYLREQGFHAEVVEYYKARRRHDLYGFADVHFVGHGIWGLVQVTSASNHSARWKKITQSDHLQDKVEAVIEAKGEVWVHSWGKKGARGKRKLWALRKERVGVDDLMYHIASVDL